MTGKAVEGYHLQAIVELMLMRQVHELSSPEICIWHAIKFRLQGLRWIPSLKGGHQLSQYGDIVSNMVERQHVLNTIFSICS